MSTKTQRKKTKTIKDMVKPVMRAAAPKSDAVTWTLVDKQKRSKLHEGRDYGMGFAFCKRSDKTLTTIMPISPCKDYLNDVTYSEITGKGYRAHGLGTKKQDIFDTHAYLVMAICKRGARDLLDYGTYAKDLAALESNHLHIQSAINHVEELLKLSDRTVISRIEDNRFAIVAPLFWMEGTYLVSLYTLLIRAALYYTGGDPMDYWRKAKGDDTYHMKGAMPKLDRLIAGERPKQDFGQSREWHNEGIVSYVFPPVPAKSA